MHKSAKIFTRAELTDDGKSRMSRIIDYGNGHRVEVPINKDGTVRWFDDSKLIRK